MSHAMSAAPTVSRSIPSVDLAAITRGVDTTLASARGIGNAAYTQSEFLTLEQHQLLAPTWICIGVGNDIPNPGDVKPLETSGTPLLMLRAANGEVRVFHNVCSHRGVRLVEAPGHVKRMLVCPYHAWTYDLDGNLFATPHIGGQDRHTCEGFDKSRHGLRRVRSAVWFDMVFVNLSGDAVDFDQHIAPLAARWDHFDSTLFRHGGADSTWELRLGCNWKLAVENHNDAYHLPWVHPSLNGYSRFEDHYDIVGDDHYAGQGSRAYRPQRVDGGPDLPKLPDTPTQWRGHAEYVALFPNAIVGIHEDHYWTVWLEPARHDLTIERMNIYYLGEEPLGADHAPVRQCVKEEWLRIWAEDQDIVERMQRGRQSPAFTGGVFSPVLDAPTHQFHRWYVRRMD